jgi:hypothetical protein
VYFLRQALFPRILDGVNLILAEHYFQILAFPPVRVPGIGRMVGKFSVGNAKRRGEPPQATLQIWLTFTRHALSNRALLDFATSDTGPSHYDTRPQDLGKRIFAIISYA